MRRSNHNQKFCKICQKMFYDVIDRYDDSNDDGNDGKFDIRKFYGDAAGLDDIKWWSWWW